MWFWPWKRVRFVAGCPGRLCPENGYCRHQPRTEGSGELLLKKPASTTAMFRFNYTKPKQQIVSNGKQVLVLPPENRQVMVSSVTDMFKGGNSIALNYLTGLGHVSRDFTASFAKEPQDKTATTSLSWYRKTRLPCWQSCA